jgi:hypothetical protein
VLALRLGLPSVWVMNSVWDWALCLPQQRLYLSAPHSV